jgi:SAM-dependent methyltransferase
MSGDGTCRGATGGGFNDLFSRGASGYARFRPRYPPALFEWLAGLSSERDLAWDCATGSGQAAIGLARWFKQVIATDASAEQIAHAEPAVNVEYRVARAEESGLPDRSVSLVTVAQALHWLDRPRFYAEARRVARSGGVVAAWCYGLFAMDPRVDAIIDRLYGVTLGDWWTADRTLVEEGYRTIGFPFEEIAAPRFDMTAEWTLADLEGYLRTWSALQRYRADRGEDPVTTIHGDLAAAWGEPGRARVVRWRLHARVGRIG